MNNNNNINITILGWKENKQTESLNECYELSKQLTLKGYNILTGGGGGFMEYANKGCYDVDVQKSFGIGVHFLDKEPPNNYIIKKNYFQVYDFYSRKMLLLTCSKYLIFFNGGIGTLDEFTDIINLIKCDNRNENIKNIVIFCYGTKFWNGIRKLYFENGLNDPLEKVFLVTDNIYDILKNIDDLKK